MELHFKYLGAMQVADKKIEGEKHVRIPAHFLQIPDTLHLVPCVPSLSAQDRWTKGASTAMGHLTCLKGRAESHCGVHMY